VLAVHGSGSWLSDVAFLDVSAATVRGTHRLQPGAPGPMVFYLLLGMGTPGNIIALSPTGALYMDAASAAKSEFTQVSEKYGPDTLFSTTLKRGGSEAIVEFEGTVLTARNVASGKGRIGFFSYHPESFEIDELSITGLPDLAMARKAYGASKLATLGL
jgi:hypothetical protein